MEVEVKKKTAKNKGRKKKTRKISTKYMYLLSRYERIVFISY